MGQTISNQINNIFKGKRKKILILGLEDSGKSTILNKLDANTFSTHVMIGLTIEEGKYDQFDFIAIDTYSSNFNRKRLTRHFYTNCEGMIYVVNSSEIDKSDEIKEDFEYLINDDIIKEVPCLVLANKQDIEYAFTPVQVSDFLEISRIKMPWLVQGTYALEGKGIHEGLNWLSTQLTKKT